MNGVDRTGALGALMAVQIKPRWGQSYDLEQLLEHAIVQVLRHRRQIERLLVQYRGRR